MPRPTRRPVQGECLCDRLRAEALQQFRRRSSLLRPPVGDQFEQQERRQVFGGDTSYTKFGKLFDRESDNTVGLRDPHRFQPHGALRDHDTHPALCRPRRSRSRDQRRPLFTRTARNGSTGFRTVAGAREDVFYGSDNSAPIAPIPAPPRKACSAPRPMRSSALAKDRILSQLRPRLSQQRSARRADRRSTRSIPRSTGRPATTPSFSKARRRCSPRPKATRSACAARSCRR